MSAILLRVREKIVLGWTQGAFACDRNGRNLSPHDPKAQCWCLGGAAYAVAGHMANFDPEAELAEALGFADVGPMRAWNDKRHRKQADVLARIDAALALAHPHDGAGR